MRFSRQGNTTGGGGGVAGGKGRGGGGRGGRKGGRKTALVACWRVFACPPHRRILTTHPSMVRAERGEEKTAARGRCFGPRVHSHRSQAATMENNELTSGLVTSDEGKYGGVPGGHASDRRWREREREKAIERGDDSRIIERIYKTEKMILLI